MWCTRGGFLQPPAAPCELGARFRPRWEERSQPCHKHTRTHVRNPCPSLQEGMSHEL